MKAIHNYHPVFSLERDAVIPLGRYQFESNSQQAVQHLIDQGAVIPLGRYQFESNSQH